MRSALVIAVMVVLPAVGSAADNVTTCLSGKYPALCNHGALTSAQRQATAKAERRENLSTCLRGRYPALCNHSLLTDEERTRVAQAERRENLSTCLNGRYPALCRHEMLTDSERDRVLRAEERENTKLCLQGRYVALCKHELLTAEEAHRVTAAEEAAARTRRPVTTARARRVVGAVGGACDSGHWVESVEDDGEVVILEDGSVWEIDAPDIVDTILWLPAEEIVACGSKLINTDNRESVGATRIH